MGLLSKWTDGEREAPEPLEGPVVGTIVTGTALWSVLFLGQLPFYGWFEEHGHTWWLWTCAAGAGLGLLGIWIVRRRDAALRRDAAGPRNGEATGPDAAAGPDGSPADPAETRPGTDGARVGAAETAAGRSCRSRRSAAPGDARA